MLWMIITVVIGSMLGPHVLRLGTSILRTEWKLKEDLSWVPYALGAIFSGITIVLFAILFLFKPQLRRFVTAYKAS